jgi:demethylmacrocin O-methyltransferase
MSSEHCILAIVHLVDKCPDVGKHTYTPYYDKILHNIRDKAKLVLEIGIGNIELMKGLTGEDYRPGASLRMWRDYFHNANVIGCDILDSVLFQEDRIHTLKTDQSNPVSLMSLMDFSIEFEKYADLIIDDGSHLEEHMATSFKYLWEFVKPGGGIYIIEDIDKGFFDRIRKLPTEFGFYDINTIEYNMGDIFDDNFIAFIKK